MIIETLGFGIPDGARQDSDAIETATAVPGDLIAAEIAEAHRRTWRVESIKGGALECDWESHEISPTGPSEKSIGVGR
jgi:hypothetical protein